MTATTMIPQHATDAGRSPVATRADASCGSGGVPRGHGRCGESDGSLSEDAPRAVPACDLHRLIQHRMGAALLAIEMVIDLLAARRDFVSAHPGQSVAFSEEIARCSLRIAQLTQAAGRPDARELAQCARELEALACP